MRFSPALGLIFLVAISCGPRTSGKSSNSANNDNGVNNAATNNDPNNGTANNVANNASCQGCSSADGSCSSGDSPDACGAGGEQCFACSDGWLCFDGGCVEPPSCGPDNCTGCCDPDRGCVTGDTAAACGAGGDVCAACVGNETCQGATCIAPCSERCLGCCDGDSCIAGTEDDSCGSGGVACEDCGDAASCGDDSVCVADSCSASCAGCCDGTNCLAGEETGACGGNGDACVDCGSGRTCADQECVVDPASLWELVLVSGAVSSTNQMGEPWDVIGSPDPVVDFELYDMSTMTAYRETSSIVQDDRTPTWNESVLTNVPASAFLVWRFDVWDSDLDFDDPICSGEADLTSDMATYQDLFSGATFTFSCSDAATGVFADLNVRLQ